MDVIVVVDDKLYKWTPFPGRICKGACDIPREYCHKKGPMSVQSLCHHLREQVGSATTHRFKEVKP